MTIEIIYMYVIYKDAQVTMCVRFMEQLLFNSLDLCVILPESLNCLSIASITFYKHG